jgi:ribosomal protein S18 acetylase RimI-like enzyme
MHKQPFTIEEATLKDLGPLRQVEKECFGRDAWPLIDLIGVLVFPGIIRLKAMAGDEMAGFISGDGSRNGRVSWITTIGVRAKFRQQGIGRMLLAACEERMTTPFIQLTVRKSNLAAIHMYQEAGYRQIELWERYYQNDESGIVMQKANLDSQG